MVKKYLVIPVACFVSLNIASAAFAVNEAPLYSPSKLSCSGPHSWHNPEAPALLDATQAASLLDGIATSRIKTDLALSPGEYKLSISAWDGYIGRSLGSPEYNESLVAVLVDSSGQETYRSEIVGDIPDPVAADWAEIIKHFGSFTIDRESTLELHHVGDTGHGLVPTSVCFTAAQARNPIVTKGLSLIHI